MARTDKKTLSRCPSCKGSGRVLLLFSWTSCGECEGTGEIADEDAKTGKYPITSSGGSEATARCDPEEGPFDDVEFDDYDRYGGHDIDIWSAED
jgi:DnaJ-class molecular chaperone